MRQDIDRRKRFTRRALVLGGLQVAALGGLVGRLYNLQVVEAQRYQVLAEENRINVRLLPPPRGLIFDRFGQGLAVNRQTYRLVLVSEQTDSVAATLDRIAALITLSDRDIRRVLKETSRRRGFVPVTVRDDLSWTEVTRVEVNSPELPGVQIEVGQSRHYPFADAVSHVTGYVGAVSEAELTGDPLLELPGFRTGKNGVERVFEQDLRGTAGTRQVEVNALGRVIREVARQEGEPGSDLTITIDMALQSFASQRMGQEAGSVVVMDIHSGDILALASAPGFDPNAFNSGLTSEAWQALLNDPKAPLINKILGGQYPPGSTFKMIVALAALETGEISPDATVYCPGFLEYGNHTFHCWNRWGHGHVGMVESIKQSCDVYFYEIANRVGIERIAAMAERFGLGSITGVELTGERAGLMPTRAWKEAVLGESWLGGETLIAGIGQGYVLTTPMQLAVMTARLANGGAAVMPRLARSGSAPARPVFAPLGIDPAHMALVQDGMFRVVNDANGGTAYGARIEEQAMAMAGKTGTAQVRRITKADREANRAIEDIPWNERDHALFVGYAPVEAPRYACAVVVEHGGGGSKVAAPIARDVLREAQRRDSGRWPEEVIPPRAPVTAV